MWPGAPSGEEAGSPASRRLTPGAERLVRRASAKPTSQTPQPATTATNCRLPPDILDGMPGPATPTKFRSSQTA